MSNDIVVTMVDIRGGRVALGSQYPDQIPVHRHRGVDLLLNVKIFE